MFRVRVNSMNCIRVRPRSFAASAAEMRRSSKSRRTAASRASWRRRSLVPSSTAPSGMGMSTSIFTAIPLYRSIDKNVTGEGLRIPQSSTRCSRTPVRIRPPRPLLSIRFGSLYCVGENRAPVARRQRRDALSDFSGAKHAHKNAERVHFRAPQRLDVEPELALRLFEFVARHGVRLSSEAERRIEARLPRLRDYFIPPQHLWPALSQLLGLPHAPAAVRAMHETGVLTAIFPETRRDRVPGGPRLLPPLHRGRAHPGCTAKPLGPPHRGRALVPQFPRSAGGDQRAGRSGLRPPVSRLRQGLARRGRS